MGGGGEGGGGSAETSAVADWARLQGWDGGGCNVESGGWLAGSGGNEQRGRRWRCVVRAIWRAGRRQAGREGGGEGGGRGDGEPVGWRYR